MAVADGGGEFGNSTKMLTEYQRKLLEWLAEDTANRTVDMIQFERHYGGKPHYSRMVDGFYTPILTATFKAIEPYLEVKHTHASRGVWTVIYKLRFVPAREAGELEKRA